MTAVAEVPLSVLFEHDETAWLEEMARRISQGRFAELDIPNLTEYLADMAKRDRREVLSRLVLLLVHLLKWEQQPERRMGSWLATILEQRRALRKLLESGTLYNHAVSVLAEAYVDARKQAAAETGMPLSAFPSDCEWDVDALMTDEPVDDGQI